MRFTTHAGVAGVALTVFAAIGCGKSAMPPPKMTETHSAIAAAEAVGANKHPRAALHLKLANDQLRQAETLIQDEQQEEARLVLERARADAELALVLTRSDQQRSEAQRALEQVRELQ